MNLLPFRRQAPARPAPDPLAPLVAEAEHICALVRGLYDGLEVVMARLDQVDAEQERIRNRLERIDGRLERAEIWLLSLDPHYPETQQALPAEVRAGVRAALARGLPADKEESHG